MKNISTGSSDVGPSLCVHTGAPWGLKNIEMDKDKAADEILKHLQTVIPGLPDPVEVKGHKWRYSQVNLLEINLCYCLCYFHCMVKW